MDAFLGRFPPSSVTDLFLFWTSHLKVGSSPFWNTNSVATVDIKRYVFVTIVDWANISILDFLAALAAMAIEYSLYCSHGDIWFTRISEMHDDLIWVLFSCHVTEFDSSESFKHMISCSDSDWHRCKPPTWPIWCTVDGFVGFACQEETMGCCVFFISYYILRNVCKDITENCEFIFRGLHGTFPILIVAGLNFAIRGRATTQWDTCLDRS